MAKRAWLAAVLALFLQSTPSSPQTRSPGNWVEAKGARVLVPAGWSHNERLLAASGPIAITNFGGIYATGGLLPPDGAEIEITSLPAPPNLVEYIRKELKGVKIDSLQEMQAGEKSGIQASYADTIAPGATLKTVVVYIVHSSMLYKFYFSFWAGNKGEQGLTSVFTNLVRESQLR